ncbi:hypothetical protein Btru_042364 [Bulinus truncatus]|nr:hypothetical protein Btru_042364 [Bulinus truncatus]
MSKDTTQSPNLPWVEKYRPKQLDDLISHKDIITTRTGKTSTILAVAKQFYSPKEFNSMVLELCEDLCHVGFALFNVIWATLYLKFWKRASTVYCYRWGTLEKKDDMLKDPRPLFKGDLVKSPVTGQMELAYPAWKRLLFRYFVTFPIIAVCLAFVFIIMLLCFELQEWVNGLIADEELPYIFSFLPKVLLAVVVSILDEVYKEIAIWLTHKARLYSVGYRIATQMSPASVEKEVRRMTRPQSQKSESQPGKTKDSSKDSDSDSNSVTEEDDEALPALTQAEVESAMKKYEDTLDDYLEMCIQFGYITLFSSAFPLAALCALLNNVIEIRSDAFKLCLTFQRPFGQRVDSIGIWQDVLLVFSVIAVIVNCLLVGMSGLLGRLLPGLSSTTYCIIIVLVEQLVSQLAANHGSGSLISHYPGSPSIRRRRMPESPMAEASTVIKEPSPPAGSSTKVCLSSQASTAASRPTDFYSNTTVSSEAQKPDVPPRSSVHKAESAPLAAQPSTLHSSVAERMVAEAMHPMFDYSDIKNSIVSQSTTALPNPPQPLKTESKGRSEVMKRVLRKKMDLEDAQRRKSEPVSAAVNQALTMQRQSTDGLKKKKVYGNKEDLKAAYKLYLSNEHLQRTMDGLNSLRGLDEATFSSSLPGLTAAPVLEAVPSASLPNPSKHVPSRPLRAGTFGDPSFLATKILSRKSRSFSTADVNEVKPAFRERFSWRGELLQSSKFPSSKKKHYSDNEVNKKTDTKQDVVNIGVCDDKTTENLQAEEDCKTSVKSQNVPSSSENTIEQEAAKPPSGLKAKEASSDSKLSVFKAFRESMSKPLSLSPRSLDAKFKKN